MLQSPAVLQCYTQVYTFLCLFVCEVLQFVVISLKCVIVEMLTFSALVIINLYFRNINALCPNGLIKCLVSIHFKILPSHRNYFLNHFDASVSAFD